MRDSLIDLIEQSFVQTNILFSMTCRLASSMFDKCRACVYTRKKKLPGFFFYFSVVETGYFSPFPHVK